MLSHHADFCGWNPQKSYFASYTQYKFNGIVRLEFKNNSILQNAQTTRRSSQGTYNENKK